MTAAPLRISAGFLEHPERQIFHVLLQPESNPTAGTILYLHPFAEEMHKARRNVAAQARLLAQRGYGVMLLDLSGCGDGSGEFVDANWDIWLQDAAFALQSLRVMSDGPLHLWGLRLGALLACELEQREEDIAKLLLWQPVLNGEQQIDQFLRLRAAAAVVGEGAAFDRKALWSSLREGHTLEVAGYELSSRLALDIAKSRLHDICPSCPVAWLEVSPAASKEIALPSRNVVGHWEDRGVQVDTCAVAGDAFWRNHDSALNAELFSATVELLR